MAEAGDSLEYPDSMSQTGSEVFFDIACKPCTSEGKNIEAQGYCTDCREHLCGQCIGYHKKFAITRNHNLIGQASMPKSLSGLPSIDICTKRCQTHSDEVIKYFCPTHTVLGCSVCVTLKHKLCEDIDYIPEVAKHIRSSQDFKYFQAKMDHLMKKSNEINQSASESLKISFESCERALQDIEAFRQRISSVLDILEDEMKRKAIELKEKDSHIIETVINKSDQVLRQLQSMSSEFETKLKDQQYCQLFIDIKSNNSKLSELEHLLKQINKETLAPYEFIPNEKLQLLRKSTIDLGKIVSKDKRKIIAIHVTDIKVKSADDTHSCWISGATLLSQDKLFVTDRNKNNTYGAKLIDTVNNKVIAKLMLESPPMDVAAVSENEVAVTLPAVETIVFLMCNCHKIVFARKMKVKGTCRGIACHKDKLFVTFDKQKKVEMMSMTGEVMQIFEKNDQGEWLFQDPTYISVSADGQFIYVSEWDNNRVVKVGMDGKLAAIYTDTELERTCKLVLDETDMMYVCCRNSNNIHLVTPDCNKVKVLLDKADGLQSPRSISYCENTGKVYIGSESSDSVKIYKLTYGQ